MTRQRNRSTNRDRVLTVSVSEEEHELLFQAAALSNKSGSGWARDLLISNALRARRAAA